MHSRPSEMGKEYDRSPDLEEPGTLLALDAGEQDKKHVTGSGGRGRVVF